MPTRARAWLRSPHVPRRLSPARHHFDATAAVARLVGHLGGRASVVEHVVVVADELTPALAGTLAAHLPAAHVTAVVRRATTPAVPPSVSVRVATKTAARVQVLMEVPPPDAILEVSQRPNDKHAALLHLFTFLRDRGAYLAAAATAGPSGRDPVMREALADLAAAADGTGVPAGAKPESVPGVVAESLERAASVASVRTVRGDVVVVKRGDHLRKLRDWAADATLDARLGPTWGATVHEEPAFTFTATNVVTAYGEGLREVGRRTFHVPEMRVRRYDGATVAARQLVTIGDYATPDTFRHPHQRRLHNGKVLEFATAHTGRVRAHIAAEPTREVAGALFHLDTEFPDHFGHVTTEVLSRCWGWEVARELDPAVRPLVSIGVGEDHVASFQLQMLAALGIDVGDVEVVRHGERVLVERLYAATPRFENPHHTHPELAETWRRLADGLDRVESPVDGDRIFVSRRGDKRACVDRPQVERFFADEGFAIVYPEDYAYAEQRALFAQARCVAGFGGSGMFGVMFAPTARVVVIAADGYGASNEELIAATNGNELHYFWGTSLERPTGRHDLRVFNSRFTFDLDRFRPALRAAIR
ncbi:glycosyltransferase family 61 protein [Cellulomonas alba]|uniref:Glycosyltransferase family 61 protein n=1 Tax=Cellulomonas alba TaxID=3053467 RepID=A0ABT7SCY9_9CELL|nr:glycosyltransferase family 61 protein [Cellulomonas alba]MDM7854040.1 glycosyltransferase family 61 protein [Cellulomonas alba]